MDTETYREGTELMRSLRVLGLDGPAATVGKLLERIAELEGERGFSRAMDWADALEHLRAEREKP